MKVTHMVARTPIRRLGYGAILVSVLLLAGMIASPAQAATIVTSRTPGSRYDTSIKVNGKWVALGTTTADASGTLALPVIRPSRLGTYVMSVDSVARGKRAEFFNLVVKR